MRWRRNGCLEVWVNCMDWRRSINLSEMSDHRGLCQGWHWLASCSSCVDCRNDKFPSVIHRPLFASSHPGEKSQLDKIFRYAVHIIQGSPQEYIIHNAKAEERTYARISK